MDKCKDCIHYDDKNTYKDTGYCHLWDGYTKNDDNCEHWEGE